jgi:hypothetical protein
MIKKILFICLAGLLVGCSPAVKMRQAVVEKHGTEVSVVPGYTVLFVARTQDGSVWVAATTPFGGKIVAETQLFGPFNQANTPEVAR